MKRIISTILAIVMVLGTCVVPFASVADTDPIFITEVSVDNQVKVTVEGYTQENTTIVLEVIKPGMTAGTDTSAYAYTDQKKSDASTGKYNFQFKLDSATAGDYTVNLFRESRGNVYSTVYKYTPATTIIVEHKELKDAVLSTSAPTSATRALFESQKEVLGFNYKLSDRLLDNQIVNGLKDAFTLYPTPQQLLNCQTRFNQQIALTAANTFNASNLLPLFDPKNELSADRYFGLTDGKVSVLSALTADVSKNVARRARYLNFEDPQKLQVMSYIEAGSFDDVSEVLDSFNEGVFISELKSSPYTAMSVVVNNNSNYLTPANLTNYNAITDSAKQRIRDIYISNNAFKITDLISANKIITEAIAAANEGGSVATPTSRPSSSGSGPSTGVVISTTTATPTPVTFTDLDSVPWAVEAINSLATAGVVSGKEPGKFDPNANVTRQEFAKMAVLAFGMSDANAVADYNDVAKNSWAYSYVASASSAGMIQGLGDGSFGAAMNITRQDVATICFRAGVKKDAAFTKTADAALNFTDKDSISEYAAKAVSILSSIGAINGMGDGTFAPQSTCTRAQAAKIIYEVSKLMK